MKASESSFIHFVRSVTLLAVLLIVPGIAIFWNQLPRDIAPQSVQKSAISHTEEPQFFRRDTNESTASASVFAPESVYPSLPETHPVLAISPPTPKVASEGLGQPIAGEPPRKTASPQDFASLELHLKSLGATYYRLEKWGSRGELFRFSCFVTPSEPYAYEKHFQAIGDDAVATMRSVIAEIETWKTVRTSRLR